MTDLLPPRPGTLTEAERIADRLLELIRSDCGGKRIGVRVISNTVHVMRIATGETEGVITDVLSLVSFLNSQPVADRDVQRAARCYVFVFDREPGRALFAVSSFRAWPAY